MTKVGVLLERGEGPGDWCSAGGLLGAKLLPTKPKPTQSYAHTLPFLEGAARRRCPPQLGGSGVGVWYCWAVLGGEGGRGKQPHRSPRGSEGCDGEK